MPHWWNRWFGTEEPVKGKRPGRQRSTGQRDWSKQPKAPALKDRVLWDETREQAEDAQRGRWGQ